MKKIKKIIKRIYIFIFCFIFGHSWKENSLSKKDKIITHFYYCIKCNRKYKIEQYKSNIINSITYNDLQKKL